MQMLLLKENYSVRNIPLTLAQDITLQYHYAHGGSNTRVYTHGLFLKSNESNCLGITWWIPPTRSCATCTYPENWQGVLSLSRLVIIPGVPFNACTFLLSKSVKMIDRNRWPCLVTYADTWQGHTGAIYKAANWRYVGMTKPEPIFTKDGIMRARKAGPFTRTRAQMESLGYKLIGYYPKHKFILVNNRKCTSRSITLF